MTRSTLLPAVALSVLLTACGGDNTEEMAQDIIAEGTTADATQELAIDTVNAVAAGGAGGGMTMSAQLQALNNSGANGQATLTGAGAQTNAAVQLSGLSAGNHPGHIHRGSCDNLGPVVVPLPAITADASGSGSATGTVAMPADSLMSGVVVNYHAPDGTPIACGPIAHAM